MSVVLVLAALALCVSAMAGAWVQARHMASEIPTFNPSLPNRGSSSALPGNVGMLASKMGDLQARMIELETLSQRIVDATGLDTPGMLPMDDVTSDDELFTLSGMSGIWAPGDAWPSDPVAGMSDWVDGLHDRVAKKREWFSLLDTALARRAGTELALPTRMPIEGTDPGSAFGWRHHPILGRKVLHQGVDFSAPYGTPIYAAAAGVVVSAGYQSGYGRTVDIQHGNGVLTRYAHASKLLVKAGELIEKGQEIAKVGATGRTTGAHLHFEVRVNDRPLDPMLFLARKPTDDTLVALQTGGADAEGQ